MLDSGDLRKGLKLQFEGDPYVIVQFEFVKPGKGQALYKCKLKNMITGAQFDRTFRSGEKFNEADLEEHQMEYLYYDGESYCFMNTSNYEQEFLNADGVGDAKELLKENTVLDMLFFEGRPIGLTLPNFVELEITHTDPWAKGDTAS
ncbi:MAG: elongation factor P, partial [Deltaproteobacteria bacterium]|nr:elongation factor P [Deltaproteobacteria bacterium]